MGSLECGRGCVELSNYIQQNMTAAIPLPPVHALHLFCLEESKQAIAFQGPSAMTRNTAKALQNMFPQKILEAEKGIQGGLS